MSATFTPWSLSLRLSGGKLRKGRMRTGCGAFVVVIVISHVLVPLCTAVITPLLPCSSGVQGIFLVGQEWQKESVLKYYQCETQQTIENVLSRDRIFEAELDWHGEATGGVPKIYYVELELHGGLNQMHRSNLNGSEEETLRDLGSDAYFNGGMALDPPNNRVWWSGSPDTIMRGTMDGSGPTDVINATLGGLIVGLEYDPAGDQLYIGINGGGIAVMNGDGDAIVWAIQEPFTDVTKIALNPLSGPPSLYIIGEDKTGYFPLSGDLDPGHHLSSSRPFLSYCDVDTVSQTVYISSWVLQDLIPTSRIDIAELSGTSSVPWLVMDQFTIHTVVLDLVGLYPSLQPSSMDGTISVETSVTQSTTTMTGSTTSTATITGSSGSKATVTEDLSGSSQSESDGMGVIIGISAAIGVIVAVVALIACVFLYRRRGRRNVTIMEEAIQLDLSPPINPTGSAHQSVRQNYSPLPSPIPSPTSSSQHIDRYGGLHSVSTGYATYGSVRIEGEVLEKKLQQRSWDINYSDIVLEEVIGKGGYGVVHKGKWRNIAVAVKLIITETNKDEFLAEAELMHHMRPHENVMQLLGVCSQPVAIVSKFYENGSLLDWIISGKEMGTSMIVKVLKGIAAGMHHLHEENVIHRDLASRNILLTGNLDAVVADFGFARTVQDSAHRTTSDIGPIKWMSPESLITRSTSKKSDVWSFGVTLWEMLTRSEPYADLDLVNTILQVTQGRRLVAPNGCHPALKQILEQCFQTDPAARPDFQQIHNQLQTVQ